MKKVIVKKLILLLLFIAPKLGMSQSTMDIELLGGITFNGNKYNYSNNSYDFKLKNGSSFGLELDIWTPKNYSVSFGYRLSQSSTRSTIVYPEGFRLSKESFSNGVLKDRVFYFGLKKKVSLGEAFSVLPFVGLYYNLFFFENEEKKAEHTIDSEGSTYVEYRNIYARFNNVGSKFYGAIGTRIGIGLEKEITNIGNFSLNLSYNWDMLRKVKHSIYVATYDAVFQEDSGWAENYYNNDQSRRFGRNMLQIEIGFKMPCSILLAK